MKFMMSGGSSSRGSSSNNKSYYVGNLVDINLTVIDRYMLEWWIVLKGTRIPGKLPMRMLRGYTSLLREHREGENRIFWKEEEDFWGKHWRRFTSRVLPRANAIINNILLLELLLSLL